MKREWIRLALAAIFGIACGVGIYRVNKRKQSAKEQGEHVPYGSYEAIFKRPLDVVLSGIALIVLSPVMLITAVLVKLKLGSPVLFKQERPGKDEHIFRLYKFRTMTDEKDESGNLLPDGKRLTKFGSFLRSTSLDELPELINIICGDMSLIGPRPLLAQYLPYYTDKERHRHDVRPGLTGLAQVSGRNLVDWDQRLHYDVEYVNRITFCGDIIIIIRTIKEVFNRKGAAPDPYAVETSFDEERKEKLKREECLLMKGYEH